MSGPDFLASFLSRALSDFFLPSRHSSLVTHYSNEYFSFARPVEFAQVDPLPTAEQQLSVLERHGDAAADERRFDMSIRVLLTVFKVRFVLRDQSFQKAKHIALNVRIGILIHRHSARSMLREHDADTVPSLVRTEYLFDVGGDIDHLFAAARSNGDIVHTNSIIIYLKTSGNIGNTFEVWLMRNTATLFLLFVFLSIGVRAQGEAESSSVIWERYNVGDQQISFLLPKTPTVIASASSCSEVEKRSFYAYADNVVYEAIVVSKSRARIPKMCREITRFSPTLFSDRLKELGTDNNAGRSDNGRHVFTVTENYRARHLFDDPKNERWVELAVHGRKDSKPNEDFLDSVQFSSDEGKLIGDGAERTIGDADVKPGPAPDPATEPVTEPLQVISKPKTVYTDSARSALEKGTVTLKVTFLANGAVGSITPETTLKYGLTEQAIAAARKITFLPKRVNGVPQNVSVTIEYSFNIY